MELTGVVQMRGSLRIVLGDLAGNTIEERLIDNTVVTVGRAWVLGQLETVNKDTNSIGWLAVGSGTIAPTTADTSLGNEVTRLAISAFVTTSLTINPPSWQAQVIFATNLANTTLAEAALLNLAAAGTMLARATFASFVKATSNTLSISYTISG